MSRSIPWRGMSSGCCAPVCPEAHLCCHEKPHKQNEIYVIVAGTGYFNLAGERFPFSPHDVIFVPKHAVHRFEEFSDDFATWVVFFNH